LNGSEDSSRGVRVVTSGSDVVGYQRFGGPCRLHPQGSPKYHVLKVTKGVATLTFSSCEETSKNCKNKFIITQCLDQSL
jgi:hypothetical protein